MKDVGQLYVQLAKTVPGRRLIGTGGESAAWVCSEKGTGVARWGESLAGRSSVLPFPRTNVTPCPDTGRESSRRFCDPARLVLGLVVGRGLG